MRILSSANIAFVLLVTAAQAQNCSQTSVGRTPIDELGTGLYQGYAGGLYPGGTNVRPEVHTIGGLAQAAQVVPRDAGGSPSTDGKIVFLSIGMSNCTQEFSTFIPLATADTTRNPHVVCVDGAQGGQTAAIIADPTANFWTVVNQRLASASATPAQVQVVWFKEADANPTQAFPVHAQILQNEFETIMQNLHVKFPNVRMCYCASRIYAGYATSTLNPEPFAYEQGFAVRWTIEDQINGSPALNYDPAHGAVMSPWIDWGTYNWADGLVPRNDGLIWQCADFISDGTHPSASGRAKVANRLLAFVQTEPTAASWYLARPPPFAYGTGKTTSIGSVPSVAWAGQPSLSAANFSIGVQHALPNGVGILFTGPSPARIPFIFATRYVGAPITRLAVHGFSASGFAAWSIPIGAAMVGTTGFYQGYMRDLANPDGTGACVSNALRVVFVN